MASGPQPQSRPTLGPSRRSDLNRLYKSTCCHRPRQRQNPVPNETVTFTAPSPASLTLRSNRNHDARSDQFDVTANSTVGAYTVVASVGGVATTADFPLTNSVGAAASITADSGSPQDAVISTAFANPLVVTVLDSGTNPVPNVVVTFTAPSNGASLSSDVQTETTDAAGQISFIVTANSTVGAYTVEASVVGGATTADFSLTNTVGAAATISADSGSPQDAVISTAFANPLVVTVLDSGTNPVPNVVVTFTAPSNGASLSSDVQTETTDAAGQISLSVTANSTVGAYTVEASVVGGATTADFSLTNTVGAAATITADSGSPQDAVISTAFANPLVVTVLDSGTNPVPNVVVTFTAPSNGASLSSDVQTETTDAAGQISFIVTANSTVGAYTVVASVVGGATTADFSLTNTVGAAATITADSGSPQDAVISTAFANPLVVTVLDSGTNPVPNVVVTFTAPSNGASLSSDVQTETTDAAGQISFIVTANSTVGAYTVEASVVGGATTADFSLTNTVGAAATITADSGSPQDAVISTAFANPLVVTVLDSGTNPVPNVVVTFTAPSNGASLSSDVQTETTDAAGQISFIVTANSTVGAYTVEASVVGGATTADFSLTNTVGAAATITADSGSPQDAVISTAFANPLVVTVLDSGTNPVPNVVVTFTAPSNGASLDPATDTAITNASGVASLDVTANSTSGGPYTVNASVGVVTETADFSLTNGRDSAADIARTKAVIAEFISTRANQIVAEQPKLVQRLKAGKFGQQKGLNSLYYDVSSARKQASFQFSYAAFRTKMNSLNNGLATKATNRIVNGFNLVGQASPDAKLGWAAETGPNDATSAINTLDSGSDPSSGSSSGFDIWAQGSYVRVENNNFESNNGLFFAGVDYRYEDTLLLGFMTQLDISEVDNSAATTSARGVGWMFGPYAVVQLQPNLYLDGQVTYGRSNNDVNALGLGFDNFDTERLLLQAGLTGDFNLDALTLNPFARLTYYFEKQEEYVDRLGNTIPDQAFTLGSLEFGPRVTYEYLSENGYQLTSFLSISGIYDFNRLTSGVPIDATLASADGNFRARFEGGVAITIPNPKIRILGEGFYDGIGVSDYEAYGGKLSLSIKF
ncbi:Ig-like domain (group 1) [Pseudovibrio sp. Tun.PSC04-5.I4]|nr:Ig-like domain (group 1) [Pseudovibrio sp. Tun.PSC04-5.I4]